MTIRGSLLAVAILSGTIAVATPVTRASAESGNQITIIYDAFGTDAKMTKDWGFSALLEIAGKRILFDTGDNAEIFAATSRRRGSTSPISTSSFFRIAIPITWRG